MSYQKRLNTIIELFEGKAKKLLDGCRITANDGTILYSPDGSAHYTALWCRDFSDMVTNAGYLIPDENIRACIEYLIKGTRIEDGWICDWRNAEGKASFAPVGLANLDNGPFLVSAIGAYLSRQPENIAKELFLKWENIAAGGIACLPLSNNGLIWNDPQNPHSPYGFTDCICKTGELFMESVLYWQACRILAKWYGETGRDNDMKYFEQRTRAVELGIHKFRDNGSGMYYAAAQDCHQVDIWGSAYAAYAGILSGQETEGVADYLIAKYDSLVMKGQVCHLPKGELWERTLLPVPEGEYQNGAYWATPSGWIAWTIAGKNTDMAVRMLEDLAESFIKDGIFECINEDYTKLPHYVLSVINPLGATKRIAGEMSD